MDPTSGGTGSVTGHVRRLRTLKRRKEEKKEAKNKVGREGKGRQSKRFECQDFSNVTKLTSRCLYRAFDRPWMVQ
jgi:hypothetical protein